MLKNLSRIVLICFVCLLFAGCTKNELKSGDVISDANIASEGLFVETIIDTSAFPDGFSKAISYSDADGYSYILICYDSVSYVNEKYFVKFDASGNLTECKKLTIPLSVFGGNLADKMDIMLDDILKVNYIDFFFDSDGSFSCLSYLSSNSETYTIDPIFYSNDILIKWDSNGNCISVSSANSDDIFINATVEDRDYIGLDGRNYKLTDSGISVFDPASGSFTKYFDFINSDVSGMYFYSVSVIDEDHFSGVYRDLEGNYVLSCFTRRNDRSDSDKVLVVACSDMDFDLKKDVFAFNTENKNYRITVIDYSDKAVSAGASEGWTLLKSDVASGFRPDLIIDSTGYDARFVSYLSDNSMAADLSGVISACFEKDAKKFSDKAEKLFYSDKNTYALVPSYYYRTIVGNSELFGGDDDCGYDDFMSSIYPLADNQEVYMDDSREAFLGRVLAFTGNRYVDYNSKTADFNADEFISYLRYAGNLPAELSDPLSRYSDVPGYVWGDSFLFDLKWKNIGDIQLVSTRFCLGDYTDFGFPSSSSEGSGVISATRSYMILSTNAYTNECWEFIKGYISDDYQNSLTEEIPVTDEAYNNWRQIIGFFVAEDSALYYFKDGQQLQVDIPDDERIKYIEDHINSCDTMIFSDYTVESIVYNYAQQYFDGQLTAEEAAAAIDRDVEAYLQSA